MWLNLTKCQYLLNVYILPESTHDNHSSPFSMFCFGNSEFVDNLLVLHSFLCDYIKPNETKWGIFKMWLNQLNWFNMCVLAVYLNDCLPIICTEITGDIFHEMSRIRDNNLSIWALRMEDVWFLETKPHEIDAQYLVLMNNEQRTMCYAITYFKPLSVRHSIEHLPILNFECSQKHLYVNFSLFTVYLLHRISPMIKVQSPNTWNSPVFSFWYFIY